MPNQTQQQLANWLLEQGVTHIIGSHPHVIQPMEIRTDGHRQHVVVYSLGNFISNMRAPHTDGGAMVTLELEKFPLTDCPIPPRNGMPILSYQPSPLAPPYSQVVRCEYSLVWTLRPEWKASHNFQLLPMDYPIDSLVPAARTQFQFFRDKSRELLKQHNQGIEEGKRKLWIKK
ncbi:capsule biosynthesis protein capA [gut metagenome]|uniref:Capsule biosynthesis protein capA n=1 Tax=gut metagenome TaxID=749906 RepID=J9CYZ6_9ZZZZ